MDITTLHIGTNITYMQDKATQSKSSDIEGILYLVDNDYRYKVCIEPKKKTIPYMVDYYVNKRMGGISKVIVSVNTILKHKPTFIEKSAEDKINVLFKTVRNVLLKNFNVSLLDFDEEANTLFVNTRAVMDVKSTSIKLSKINVRQSIPKKVYKITNSNGDTLIVGDDSDILTIYGYVHVGRLYRIYQTEGYLHNRGGGKVHSIRYINTKDSNRFRDVSWIRTRDYLQPYEIEKIELVDDKSITYSMYTIGIKDEYDGIFGDKPVSIYANNFIVRKHNGYYSKYSNVI